MYSVGRKLVPLHVLCGEWHEILFNGVRFCIIVGDAAKAQTVVDALNAPCENCSVHSDNN